MCIIAFKLHEGICALLLYTYKHSLLVILGSVGSYCCEFILTFLLITLRQQFAVVVSEMFTNTLEYVCGATFR